MTNQNRENLYNFGSPLASVLAIMADGRDLGFIVPGGNALSELRFCTLKVRGSSATAALRSPTSVDGLISETELYSTRARYERGWEGVRV
jgi:hypothetical protein